MMCHVNMSSSAAANHWAATAIRFLLAHSVSVWKSLELKHSEFSELSGGVLILTGVSHYKPSIWGTISGTPHLDANVQSFRLLPVDPVPDPAATTSDSASRSTGQQRMKDHVESKGTPGKP